jgi:hypothetical protein
VSWSVVPAHAGDDDLGEIRVSVLPLLLPQLRKMRDLIK